MAIIQGNAVPKGASGFYPKTIDQSLRFEDGDSPYLRWTPASAGDRRLFTLSCWVKRGNIGLGSGDNGGIFVNARNGDFHTDLSFDPSDRLKFRHQIDTGNWLTISTQKFRDTSSWYHIVLVYDSANATASNRVKMYVNGVQITAFDTAEYIDQNRESFWNTGGSYPMDIGGMGTAYSFDGYLAEVHFTDGTAYDADDFGELKSGIWVPKADISTTVTYGTNGFYLDFADSAAIGDDESGNTNDWTVNNLVASDVVPDSPTNNFAVLNNLAVGGNFSEGNLKHHSATSVYRNALSTLGVSSGKWYAEFYVNQRTYETRVMTGVALVDKHSYTTQLGADDYSWGLLYSYTNSVIYKIHNGVDTPLTSTGDLNVGDVVMVALDLDNNKLWFGENGTWLDSGDPAGNSNEIFTIDSGTYVIGNANYDEGTQTANFGQDSTFAGNTTAGGNSDANGIGDFKYAPPSGYLALCTSNLPDPAIDPAQEATADQYFNVYTYTGNGASQLIGDVVREIPDTYPISQSLRFEDGDSAYLNKTLGSGDSTEWTWSAWVKRGNLGTQWIYVAGPNSGTNISAINFNSTDTLRVYNKGAYFTTTATFKDPSAWYHIVVEFDSDNATNADRVKIYVNGVRQDGTMTGTMAASHINDAQPHYLGYYPFVAGYYDGYMAEVHFTDGTAYDADTFGVFDADGLWRPIEPTVTYGTNGFHLDFADSADIGDDNSGNTNDFTVNNLVASDVVIDTPTNSFATFDSSSLQGGAVTLSEGNSYYYKSTTGWAGARQLVSTALPSTGKWYYELIVVGGSSPTTFVGLATRDAPTTYAANSESYMFYSQNGNYYSSSTNASYGTSWGNAGNRVIGIAYDADNATLEFFINNSSQGTVSVSGGHTGKLYPVVYAYTSTEQGFLNFGQDGTGAGTYTGSQDFANYEGATDGNGEGEFFYAPPTGFLALCENNLIQYDDNPLESPDFVWIKTRSAIVDHRIFDSVRGVNNSIRSNTTSAEATEYNSLTSFNKNGFTIGDHASVNTSGSTYVGWNWKAGSTASTIAVGAYSTGPDVPSIASTVSANTDAGFSIVSYTGNGTAGATVGHGLDSAPELIIGKSRDSSTSWQVYHEATGATKLLTLNLADGAATNSTAWNNTEPTSTVFTLGTGTRMNASGDDNIAYCFHSVDGYSKVGGYTGNNLLDGPFVYTGFRPKWVMFKNAGIAGDNWDIRDAERSPFNDVDDRIYASLDSAEGVDSAADVDFLSNGFKIRTNADALNESSTYIYLAFAEQPFKYSNAR